MAGTDPMRSYNEAVEVIQADRDAASALTGDEIMAYGMADLSDAVQAFARHRLASSTPEPVATTQAPDAVEPGEEWYSSVQLDEVSALEANDWLEWTRFEGGCSDAATIKAMHEKIKAALSTLPTADAGPVADITKHPCYNAMVKRPSHRAYVSSGPMHCERCNTELDKDKQQKPGAPLRWGQAIELFNLVYAHTVVKYDPKAGIAGCQKALDLYAAPTPPAGDEGLVERLRDALEPFASVCDAFDYWVPEVMPDFSYPIASTDTQTAREDCPNAIGALSESDFRRARSIIQAISRSEGSADA